MQPASIIAGDTWTRGWQLTDAAKVPIDLTGATARLHVRDTAGTLILSATVGDGITIEAALGKILLSVPTAGVAVGSYKFALEVTFADATILTVETETLIVSEDITHD